MAGSPPMPPRATTIAFDVMGSDHGPAEVVRGAAQLIARGAAHPRAAGRRSGSRSTRRSPRPGTAASGSASTTRRTSWGCTRSRRRRSADSRRPRCRSPPSWWRRARPTPLVSAGNTGAGVLACARHLQAHPRRAAGGARQRLPDADLARHEGGPVLASSSTWARRSTRPPRIWSPSRSWARPTRASSRKNPDPTVALLSNGTEATKGPPRVVEAHARLAQHAGMHFVGNVEGVDIPKGTADVVGLRRLRRQRLPEDAGGRGGDGGRAGPLRLQGEAAVADRPGDAAPRIEAAQGRDRLGAVRRRAGARVRSALHQGARTLEGAGHRQRRQGGRQGGARRTWPSAIREGLSPSGS